MAAHDTFEKFLESLSSEEKENLKELIRRQREGMFAARSEDARVRLVHEFLHQVHESRKRK
jgi:hypothetical protein